MYTRRPDLVGFVNGLPLVLMEFKAAYQRLETAYTGNLSDYKYTIPHPELTKKERKQVKKTTWDLLNTLKDEKLVLDW